MSITIAAPGPSLFKSAARRLMRVDIAVNAAGNFIASNWLATHDVRPPSNYPRRGIVTLPRHADRWHHIAPHLTIVDARMYRNGCYFSSETAINHAARLAKETGETAIDIYGMDLCGDAYCDGSPLNIGDEYFLEPHMNNEERLAERWRHERDAVGDAIQRANNQGLAVVVHP